MSKEPLQRPFKLKPDLECSSESKVLKTLQLAMYWMVRYLKCSFIYDNIHYGFFDILADHARKLKEMEQILHKSQSQNEKLLNELKEKQDELERTQRSKNESIQQLK